MVILTNNKKLKNIRLNNNNNNKMEELEIKKTVRVNQILKSKINKFKKKILNT